MNITLRLLEEKDLEWSRQLRNENRNSFFNSKAITPEQHKKWFDNLKCEFYIIYADERPVGTISIKENCIGNVIIKKEYRHKSIMKRAMKLLLSKKNNIIPRLEVKADNTKAIKAYLALGFKPIILIMEKKA